MIGYRTWAVWTIGLLAILLFTVGIAVSWGSGGLSVTDVWRILFGRLPGMAQWVGTDWPQSAETIVWQIRMPRIVLAALVGAALSVAGAIFQGVLRNPLADPYILGVSSGAALGAAIVIFFGVEYAWVGRWTLPLVAFLGGCLTLLLVFSIARGNGHKPMETLILAGVIVQAFLGAVLSLLIALSHDQLQKIIYWMLGSVALLDWREAWVMIPYLLVGLLVAMFYSRELNILALGERTASHTGVAVVRTRIILLIVASLLTGAAVAIAGVIGFVGLVVPHMLRLLIGSDHRVLVPLSVLAGAVFMIWADTFARLVLSPRELPVGVLTACVGAPLFAYLLQRRANRLS